MKKIQSAAIFFIFFLGFFSFLSGCSKTAEKKSVSAKRKDVIIGELTNSRRKNPNLPPIQSVELLSFVENPVYSIKQSFAEITRSGFDDSQINTMFDGFGNKTEIRSLANDPILRCIISKTSVNGQKQVFVFGKNGEVKRLHGELLDKVMTAGSSLIAKNVGINDTAFKQKLPSLENLVSENTETADNRQFAQSSFAFANLPDNSSNDSEIIPTLEKPMETAQEETEAIQLKSTEQETARKKSSVGIKLQIIDIRPSTRK